MKFNNRTIEKPLVLLLSLIFVFHFLIVFGIIPYKNVWVGRLKSREELLKFESFSIILNAIFIAVVLVKANLINIKVPKKVINVLLWIMAIVFALNTIGNLFAIGSLEKYIATPVTFLLSIFCFILARNQ